MRGIRAPIILYLLFCLITGGCLPYMKEVDEQYENMLTATAQLPAAKTEAANKYETRKAVPRQTSEAYWAAVQANLTPTSTPTPQ